MSSILPIKSHIYVICKGKNSCGQDKPEGDFRAKRHMCKLCESKNNIIWQKENPDKTRAANKKFKENNPNYKKEWKENNKEHRKEYERQYNRTIEYKLSAFLKRYFKKANTKRYFDAKKLKTYLELLFEPWMNLANYGKYNPKTWKNDDLSTWTWGIKIINKNINSSEYILLTNLKPVSSNKVISKDKKPHIICNNCGKEKRCNSQQICRSCIGKINNKRLRLCLKEHKNTDILNNILLKEALKIEKCSGPCQKEIQLTKENFRLKGLSLDLEKIYWNSECRNCEKRYEKTRDKEKIRVRQEKRQLAHQKRLEEDPEYRKKYLEGDDISVSLSALITGYFYKGYVSCELFLPYTAEILKNHLASQFEWWMTFDNHGKYRKATWKDDDPTTWVWSIDHIIPKSEFHYTSVNDEEFKKCWALDNLRPYSAKQNCLDGVNRTRHKKKKAA